MPILSFVVTTSGKILVLPLVLFVADMFVTTFVKLAFGTTSGFFRPRISSLDKRKSLVDIVRGDV